MSVSEIAQRHCQHVFADDFSPLKDTRRGISLLSCEPSTTTARFEKGLAAQKSACGDRNDTRYAPSSADHRRIDRLLCASCFADCDTRNSVGLATREWLTFAFVAVLGGRESQFGDHVTGTGPVGGRRDELIAAITQLLPFIGYPRPFNALKIINDEMFA